MYPDGLLPQPVRAAGAARITADVSKKKIWLFYRRMTALAMPSLILDGQGMLI